MAKNLRIRGGCGRGSRAGGFGCQPCESSSPRQRRKREVDFQAIGPTKGGKNSKIHAIADKFRRPWVLMLTPGNTADCVMAKEGVGLLPGLWELLAGKGYEKAMRRL